MAEFGLLGDVEARAGDRIVELGHARQRGVLAALLVDAGRTVSTDQLVDRIWSGNPPLRSRETVYSYLSRLRRALAGIDGVALRRGAGGYLLAVDPAAVDLHRFRELVARARSTHDEQALTAFEAALRLWRGEAFAGLDGEWFARLRADLEREHLAAELDRNDLYLRRGRHAELLAGLTVRVAEHPLDERLAGQLMLALHRSGRRADATRHFHVTRALLVDEVGVEPGPYLQDLHQHILASAPNDGDGDRPAAATATGPPVPAQLPGEATGFTGRDRELTELHRHLAGGPESSDDGTSAVRISVISGTAGVGKTALALRAAHRLREGFPDGQLHVNLRGYDPDEPVPTTDALIGFLRALGVPGPQIPTEPVELSAAYRSVMSGRRVLVVLDNAASAEQVRPLLPGTSSAAVLVTSRETLAGLVARDGARRLPLDRLPPADSIVLLQSLVGARAVDDPDATTVLAQRCAHLPLALRIAAELAVARPAATLAGLVGELADEQRRLELLDAAGDPRTAVQAVFSWSYHRLTDDAARTFRLLGLHPGPDLDPYAATALVDGGLERTRDLLGGLARGHLVQEVTAGRYEMHDLLRAYAVRRSIDIDRDDERRNALTRLLDHYLHGAGLAMDALVSAETPRRPPTGEADGLLPPFDGPADARAWLDTERAALTTACVHAATRGWPTHATDLAGVVARYYELGGHYPEAIALHTHARDAARRTGDRAGEARASDNLGLVHRWQGRYPDAADQHRRAVALFHQVNDRHGEAYALGNLGVVAWQQGHHAEAAEHQLRALDRFREIGDRTGEARIISTLGFVRRRQGRYREAEDCHRRALQLFTDLSDPIGVSYTHAGLGLVLARIGQHGDAITHHRHSLELFRQNGDRAGEAYALANLGIVTSDLGDLESAAELQHEAMALARAIGDQATEAYGLDDLGVVHRRRGDYVLAKSYHRRSLAWCRDIGERPGEARAGNSLGETCHAAGDHRSARDAHASALALATGIGDLYEQARAHHGLARCGHALGDAAARHWREALDLYTDLEVPEAADVRAELDRMTHGRTTVRRRVGPLRRRPDR